MARRKSSAAAAVKGDSRLAVNLFSAAMTVLVLFAATEVSQCGLANSIDKIGRNLDVALRELMDDAPAYTNYTEAETYLSDASFNPRGMAGLYNLTVRFMDVVLPRDFLMDDLLVVKNGNLQLGTADVPEVLQTYWRLLLVLIVLVLVGALIPLCGLLFCCCRCCGNCGARSKPCDKKRDLCKKILQGMLLIVLGTALLFCVVCAFASNQQMQDGIEQFPENIKHSKADTKSFLESAKKQARHLLVTNYDEFSDLFTQTINKSSKYVMQQLEIWSNATAMMDLHAFVAHIPKIKESLETLKTDTNSLRASASQLNDAMRKVKKDLLNTLENCDLPDCKDIKNNISQLQTNIDFNKLPDVSPTLNQLGDIDTDALKSAVEEGMGVLNGIETEIKSKLDENLQKAADQVKTAGGTIATNLNNITEVITSVQNEIDINIDPFIRDVNGAIKEYGSYRYYGGLVISCVLLLVTICIALGLVCGICGKIPDGYSDNCCNKGAGSQFLICSVMIMFIFGIVVALVTICAFVLGLATDRIGCYPLRNPDNSKIINLVDNYLNQSVRVPDINLSIKDALNRCYKNESIYNVFNLKTKFDIEAMQDKFDVSSYLDQMLEQLNGILSSDFEILSKENEETLENLKTFDPSINFDQFQDELKENFTNLSLDEISKKLKQLVETISLDSRYDSVKTEVSLSILHINTYDEKLLIPMKEKANSVIGIAKQLDLDLKMNSTSFSVAITKLLQEIKEAQKVLKNNGTQILKKVAKEFGTMVLNQVNSYLYRVGNVTKNELAQCGPLNVVIQSTLTATCDKILLPWNGFWFSLFLALMLFVPTIIVSDKLATLYQKYKQYGQYVETRVAKRDKKKPKKAKHYEDRPQHVGAGDAVAREYATGSHPPDTRYADMAPKHWEEFPNGGPPQYQRAPTEYERPPPYYYPGSGEQ